jgi:hypothetical protein
MVYLTPMGLDSVVGYSETLVTGRFGNQILLKAKFSEPVQTGSGARPASCTMDTESLSGRMGRGVDHPPFSGAKAKERVELYLCSCSMPSWSVLEWTSRYCGYYQPYDIYLTAVGLTPGGSSTVHIYTQTRHQDQENGHT